MKRSRIILGLLVLVAFMGCSQDRVTAPGSQAAADFDAEFVATQIVQATGWEVAADVDLSERMTLLTEGDLSSTFANYERECLGGDIYHYSFDVPVGPGQYDVIRLHRVVREVRPFVPKHSPKSIFLQHGDAVGFVKFLFGAASPNAPDDHALAIYLAAGNVDVWGIDQNWVLVPGELASYDFMADWGIQNQVDNVRAGMAVARTVRYLTGSGYDRMNLLGYSSGVWTGYATLNHETQLPTWQRHVKGFIPADGAYKIDPAYPEVITANCDYVTWTQEAMDMGIYEDTGGTMFQILGYLGETDPGGDSPILPGMTNLDAFLLFGGQTYLIFAFNPYWHYFSPILEDGVVVGLNDTPLSWALDFVQTASPVEALRFLYDYSAISCDAEDVPYDDYLDQITVPILYVSPVGGISETGFYTLDLLGSSDVTVLNIQLQPDGHELEDFGHIDLWTAPNAPQLVWQPILHWIRSHPGHGGGRHGGGNVSKH